MMKKRFPSTVYNPTSAIGAGLALFGAAAEIILFVLDAISSHSNPYLGIFTFMVFPGVLVFGLLLIPAGMLWERRRRRLGKSRPLVIDFGLRQHRNAIVVFVSGTSIFLLLTTVGLYGAYEFSESVEFCGEVCHEVMEPEHVAYHNSAHAKVACVKCHIGPGAEWYARSKISGARQVIKVLSGTFPRPISTPIEDLRPAREVCEQCHWPGKYFSTKKEVLDYYLGDEANTHWRIRMLVNVGGERPVGEPTGSHWHVTEGNRITYVAADHDRQEIEQVILHRGDEPILYSLTGAPLPDSVLAVRRAEGRVREMDCIDCHNRPAHVYRSPMRCVDEILASGELDSSIPWIKRQATLALSQEYADREEAQEQITASLRGFYEDRGETIPDAAINAVLRIYSQNFFPEMKVRWDHYPDNSNHLESPGCFRCHGSGLRTAAGRAIGADCSSCHTILSQGAQGAPSDTLILSGLQFRHPIDIRGAERELHCTECHFGDASLYFPKEVQAAVVNE